MRSIRILEMATEALNATAVTEQLAGTGGDSLAAVWWIAGGLIFAGAIVGVLAYLSKRKRAAASSVPAAEAGTKASSG